jgi:hypothetical protein
MECDGFFIGSRSCRAQSAAWGTDPYQYRFKFTYIEASNYFLAYAKLAIFTLLRFGPPAIVSNPACSLATRNGYNR